MPSPRLSSRILPRNDSGIGRVGLAAPRGEMEPRDFDITVSAASAGAVATFLVALAKPSWVPYLWSATYVCFSASIFFGLKPLFLAHPWTLILFLAGPIAWVILHLRKRRRRIEATLLKATHESPSLIYESLATLSFGTDGQVPPGETIAVTEGDRDLRAGKIKQADLDGFLELGVLKEIEPTSEDYRRKRAQAIQAVIRRYNEGLLRGANKTEKFRLLFGAAFMAWEYFLRAEEKEIEEVSRAWGQLLTLDHDKKIPQPWSSIRDAVRAFAKLEGKEADVLSPPVK